MRNRLSPNPNAGMADAITVLIFSTPEMRLHPISQSRFQALGAQPRFHFVSWHPILWLRLKVYVSFFGERRVSAFAAIHPIGCPSVIKLVHHLGFVQGHETLDIVTNRTCLECEARILGAGQ